MNLNGIFAQSAEPRGRKMNIKHCYVCGEKLKLIWDNSYNQQTGEKNFKPYCPKGKCGHTPHVQHETYRNVNKKKKFEFKTFIVGKPDSICLICGEHIYFAS